MNSRSEERPKIAVIGGGAAGFFGAIQIASEGTCEVILLEKGKQFLSKVKISGGGRCNVTHHCLDPETLSKNLSQRRKRTSLGF